MTVSEILVTVVAVAAPTMWAADQLPVPAVDLQVAVQQRDAGQLSPGIHLLRLTCSNGQCAMTTLTLNQCMVVGSPPNTYRAFSPKIEMTNTIAGDLAITAVEKNAIELQETIEARGTARVTYRFGFEPPGPGAVANDLVSFSGGFVKSSAKLKRVITIELVPLPKWANLVPLDCPALLPGVLTR